MHYFRTVKSFDDLKTQYRALAMQHHPDRGGDLATMQGINAEYDSLYTHWNHFKASDEGYESAQQYRAGFYREQGWTGQNYRSGLPVKEIAVLFRAYAKKHWPQCKFSVTSDCYTIRVALTSAPFSPWADLENEAIQRKIEHIKCLNRHYDPETTIRRGNYDVNRHYIDDSLLLSPVAKTLFKDIAAFIQSYNFDYSDIQSDYFHVNFYLYLSVGKWNKPFVQRGNMSMADSTEIKEAA